MSGTRWLVGGLAAVGLVAMAADAKAQFPGGYAYGHPFGAGYRQPGFVYPGAGFGGGSFVTPSGGVVTRSAAVDPFTGNTIVSKSYVNPYTGTAVQKQYVAPGFGGPAFGYPVVAPVVVRPVYAPVVYPGAGFTTGGFGVTRGGVSFGVSFGRTFP